MEQDLRKELKEVQLPFWNLSEMLTGQDFLALVAAR
jgi:hypothetical protein